MPDPKKEPFMTLGKPQLNRRTRGGFKDSEEAERLKKKKIGKKLAPAFK